MAAPLGWVVIAITCASMWGLGYSFLSPVTQVLRPAVLNTVYGALLFCTSFLVCIWQDQIFNFFEMGSQPKIALFVFLYSGLFISASSLQLVGYKLLGDTNSGPYNAICSCYPLVNLILSYIFFNQRSVNFAYVAPGMLCIVVGVVLLAIAPPLPTADIAPGAGAPGSPPDATAVDSKT